MRVVTNEALLKRNRTIAHALFFVSLAGMGIGFFYTWSNPATSSQLSCLLLPALLVMTVASVRMANVWIREPRPEKALAEALKGIGQRYTLFNHLLPAPHVLIGPQGVFTITTMWHEKAYKVSGRKWSGDGGLGRFLFGFLRQDLLGDPFREAEFQAQQMQKLVDKIAPDSNIQVQPVVVFISPKVSLEIEDPAIPVVYANPKKKPNLRQFLRTQKSANRPTLTPEQLDQIDEMYGLITRQELETMGLEVEEEPETAEFDEDEEQPAAATDQPAKPVATVSRQKRKRK